jgi:hypothetical protein
LANESELAKKISIESYAMGGGLDNHGLKEGDQIIKTMSGGVQKVKTKSGDIVYVDLANGYRGTEPSLPFDNGGGISQKDLFEDYKNQPTELAEIVNNYMEKFDEGDYDYDDTKRFLEEVEAIGYTFDYGLDNEPYALRPIGVELSQVEGHEDMGDDDDYFKKGGRLKRNLSRDRKFKNYSQDHEVRYSKDKPQRKGYGFEDGGMMGDDGQMPKLNLGKHKND